MSNAILPIIRAPMFENGIMNRLWQNFFRGIYTGNPANYSLSGIIQYTISVSEYDFEPPGLRFASTIELSSGGSDRSISGIAQGYHGRILILHNIDSVARLVLLTENAGSVAGNRFSMNESYGMLPLSSVMLQYSTTINRWRLVATGL